MARRSRAGLRSVNTPGGTRTRSFRIESPASFRFDHRGVRKLRWQGSNLRFAINSRASYRSTTPERKAEAAGFEPAWRQATGALAMRCLSRSAMPPGGRRGSRTPKAGAHPFSRRDTAPDGSPSEGDPGRARTCTTPIKSRPLYRIELRSQKCGRQESNLQRPAFQAGALPALSYDHADGRGWSRIRLRPELRVRQALGLSELLAPV
jgi:hypothetical protein